MATNKKLVSIMVLMLVMVGVVIEGSRALDVCNMSEDDLMNCKPSVTKPDPVDPPPPECCGALSRADLKCLCSYRNSLLLPSLGIDPDLALALPAKCNLTTPPQC